MQLSKPCSPDPQKSGQKTHSPVPEKSGKKSDSAIPQKSGTFFVTYAWWDGKLGSTHIHSTDLDAAQERDEKSELFARTWTSVIPCPGMFTCTCTADFQAIR